MGKVQVIQKSRKEYRCNKCGAVIPVGSSYYKGEINFGPTIIRCKNCGLEHWEVTTSDYILSAGAIVYKWSETYGCDEDGLESIKSEVESLKDDLQDRLDNMPEQLQYSPTGELLQERIDGLDSAIDELDSIYPDDIKSEVASEFLSNRFVDEEDEIDEDTGYEELLDKLTDDGEKDELVRMFESELESAISQALESIEV